METVVVKLKNNQPRLLGLCTGHQLLPGRGKVHELEMTEEQRAQLFNDPTFRSWCKLGWIGQLQPSAPPAPEAPHKDRIQAAPDPVGADALDGVNVEQAKVMITVASDPDLLAAWHARDARKTVKKAVEARLAELNEDDENTEDHVQPVVDLVDGE